MSLTQSHKPHNSWNQFLLFLKAVCGDNRIVASCSMHAVHSWMNPLPSEIIACKCTLVVFCSARSLRHMPFLPHSSEGVLLLYLVKPVWAPRHLHASLQAPLSRCVTLLSIASHWCVLLSLPPGTTKLNKLGRSTVSFRSCQNATEPWQQAEETKQVFSTHLFSRCASHVLPQPQETMQSK